MLDVEIKSICTEFWNFWNFDKNQLRVLRKITFDIRHHLPWSRHNKETIVPLWRETTGDWWIPHKNDQLCWLVDFLFLSLVLNKQPGCRPFDTSAQNTMNWPSTLVNIFIYPSQLPVAIDMIIYTLQHVEAIVRLLSSISTRARQMMAYGVMQNPSNHTLACALIVNTLRLKQDGCHVTYDIFEGIFVNEICCIFI